MALTNDTDKIAALTEAAKRYYQAMVAGDETTLRSLFDKRTAIVGHFEGELLRLDIDDFIAETKSLIGQHGEESCVVESVRVDGDIGHVVVGGRYMNLWFMDHLSLLAVNDHWIITGKSFHVTT